MSKGIETTLEELINLRREANQLDFSARKISHSRLAGRYHSHFRGRGMDYFESRPYVDGDDVRNIDWRVTARTGSLHSKIFVEERDRPILLVVDFSPSMFFGTRNALKSVVAARMAAMLAWYANKNGDRVGGLLFTPDQEVDIRPTAGRSSVLAVLRALAEATAQHQSKQRENRLVDALDHAAKVARPGSLVLLLSDFYAAQSTPKRAALRQSLHRLAVHSDVIGFMVSDPIEHQLPENQSVPLSDGRQRFRVGSSQIKLRSRIEAQFKDRAKWVESEFGQLGLPVIPVLTTDNLLEAIHRPVRSYA